MGTSMPALVDLRAEADGSLILGWAEAPGARNRALALSEIAKLRGLAEDVGQAEADGRSAAIVKTRAALSAELFALFDGPERALAQRLSAAEEQGRRLDLVVRARAADRRALHLHPATWMRLEMLPFAEMLRAGTPPLAVVLQLGAQGLAPPRLLPGGGLRIGFMASSAHDAPPELDFEREEEELLAAIAPLAEKRRARLRVIEEGSLEGLRSVALVERFDVLHLTGHGVLRPEGPRLVMEDTFGAKRLVAPAELLEVLKAAKQMPELVMVSCCHSAEVRGSVASFAAELVAGGVPNVLGWTRPVRDRAATLAATAVYEQLGTSKTPLEATETARDRMRQADERSPTPSHDWGTLQLISSSAAGFRVDDTAAPLSERAPRQEVYRFLGPRMRVLETGFVGRRRLVQRLLRVLLRGQEVAPDGARDVAGACVFGMKGVGKSCAVGRAIERAKQHAPELQVVVIHGEIDERGVLEAFQESIRASGGDEVAEGLLARTGDDAFQRARRVMERWRRQHVAVVLDDFEQNLEPSTSGPFRLKPAAAAFLGAVLPACTTGKPKLLITSTAEIEMPSEHAQALAFVPLGPFEPASIRKLWNRGQASNDLTSVSLGTWEALAARLGRNARILTWARALLAGKTDAELAKVAADAAVQLPVWALGDAESEEKQAELARLFLQHMAYANARAAFGNDALTFVKRARVFEAAVPAEAFAPLAEGLGVDLARDLDALASWGLVEVGELDGARAYRVSPLVEPKLDVPDAPRWHEAASAAWEALAGKASHGGARLERVQAAWEHALLAGEVPRADRLARRLDALLHNAGLYADNLRLAERHVAALPQSPFGYQWAAYAAMKAGSPARAVERAQRGLALQIQTCGTEEHPNVAASLHELGGVLRAQGDLGGARKALEHSLAIQATVLGTEEHPDVAASLHSLGGVLQAQGDLGGARKALERSLAIQATVLGTEEHPDVAASLHELGGVLKAQGDLGGARKALERSLAITATVLGTEEHPDVAASLNNLAVVLHAQQDLLGARVALERSLRIKDKCYGTRDHYMSAETEVSLAMLLFQLGHEDEAREMFQHAVRVLAEQVPGHPILQQLRALQAQV